MATVNGIVNYTICIYLLYVDRSICSYIFKEFRLFRVYPCIVGNLYNYSAAPTTTMFAFKRSSTTTTTTQIIPTSTTQTMPTTTTTIHIISTIFSTQTYSTSISTTQTIPSTTLEQINPKQTVSSTNTGHIYSLVVTVPTIEFTNPKSQTLMDNSLGKI